MRIDLHTHSLCSDGSDTPTELVTKAAAAGLDVVGLTDHDTTAGWAEAQQAAAAAGIGLVLGVEFSVGDQEIGRHLLGYGFDPAAPAVAEILRRSGSAREDRVERLFERLDELDIGVDRDFVTSLAGGIPSRKHIAAGLVRAGVVPTEEKAFSCYLNEGRPAHVQRFRPSIEEAIAAIAQGGGVSVIAHPRDGSRGAGVDAQRFLELAQVGLGGIEVDHQQHDTRDRQELRAIASDLGLAATGSSDYHGTRKIDHDLGCNLTDPQQARRLLGDRLQGLGTDGR